MQRAEAEFERAMKKLRDEIRTGMAHGFFELSVQCEIIHGAKRQLTIRTGKSYRFVISEEECAITQ
jgi:hypothetical protein